TPLCERQFRTMLLSTWPSCASGGNELDLTRRTVIGGIGMMAAIPSGIAAPLEHEMSDLPFAATTPISVGRVGLKAQNATQLADFYSAVVGLEQLSADGETITLGAKGRPLLVIEGDSAAKPDDPRSAGLFHTAFLLP